ncbi:hypothetical protein [Salinivibrio socompensis]|uniref:hypothetical protein n=1 Tax=Salinivibrio socompensis TaxID=1510206 RepID=UPI0004713CAA|nr:hypothetical protein [Salinivibrio socompensis]
MAAEKLTRGRLAQIIVMLTLLVVAFFWRTLIYTPRMAIIECKGMNGFCGTSQSQEKVEYEWNTKNEVIHFSLVSESKPHSAFWEQKGKQAPELSQSQSQEGGKYRVNWQWSRVDLPANINMFNVVFDQYQFKFNYPKRINKVRFVSYLSI